MLTHELTYELPEELIAQYPLPERDAARLLRVDAALNAIAHRTVRDLPGLLPPSLIVVNDTKVFPARLHGTKRTGGRVELLLISRDGPPSHTEHWRALGRASKGLPEGTEVSIGDGALHAVVERKHEGGELDIVLRGSEPIDVLLGRIGEVPLPPYIRRAPEEADRDRYQTVYAAHPGAVAAPTAGLHLSAHLLDTLRAAGHLVCAITLHVGPGTFAPVKTATLAEHPMHREHYEISEDMAHAFARAKKEKRIVLAVGTTVVRALESAVRTDGTLASGGADTSLLISPPYTFRAVDALLTNFHLPRSTLLALVMAFGGVDLVRRAYAEAVDARYRFFSYGDAMLLTRRSP